MFSKVFIYSVNQVTKLSTVQLVCVGRFILWIGNGFWFKFQVITTVGTEEKRQYLLSRFPSLVPENILDSRSNLFEFAIMSITKGKGVNVVLNSLAGDKLQASVRVLSQHARFLEIGKFDLANNSAIGKALSTLTYVDLDFSSVLLVPCLTVLTDLGLQCIVCLSSTTIIFDEN